MVINVYGEISSVILGCLILFFMLYSNPRKTLGYMIDFVGIILGMIGSITLLFIGFSVSGDRPHNALLILIAFIVYGVCYIGILNLILTYIYYLTHGSSYNRPALLSALIFCMFYGFIGFAYFSFIHGFHNPFPSDAILLQRFIMFCCQFGLVACVIVLILTFLNRNKLPKVILLSMQIFSVAMSVTLIFQLFFSTKVFISLTYTVPFMACYLLFHSNPYDEETGTQNGDPLNTKISDSIKKNKKFIVVFVSIPQLEKTNFVLQESSIHNIISDIARRTERICNRSYAYRISTSTYAAFTYLDENITARDYFDAVIDIISHPTGYEYLPAYFKAIGISHHPFLRNIDILQHYFSFLQTKVANDAKNECLFAGNSEMTAFMEYYRVHLALEDIRDRKDLNDPRVLAYAQPIFSVEKKAFLSAEALMRLEIDGNILYPGTFIPIAEESRCIHSLTCIILNKVCQEIRRMDDNYEFDCITVNCSPLELSVKSMTDDLLRIIEDNQIDPHKIRLEVTESSVYENYDSVANNMQSMNDEGIHFYLDDFGTGYSNFDRLTSGDFHTIKFDKTILYKAMQDENTEEMILALIHMLKESNIAPLVEGVETDEQTQFCINHGFDYIQGYKYAKPVPIERLREYFEGN
ncbi:MAG: EAL domain-containing protein [Lachnospiraceae bacterium]|nr:EAL domain-containing protein [Lachnospiraceae bacterium]